MSEETIKIVFVISFFAVNIGLYLWMCKEDKR